jgi:hypothetical protein
MTKRWRVSAPMITCRSPSAAPVQPPARFGGLLIVPVTEFYRDDVLPPDVPAGDITHLREHGLIEPEPD